MLGTISVLEAAPIAWMPGASSTAPPAAGCTGTRRLRPTPEEHADPPARSVRAGEAAAEGYCELYARLHGLSTVSLRYGNVYGPRQDVHGEAGVVAIFCGCVLDGRRPTVFGDGRQTRDWVEVADVVRANLLAAESTLTGPINIGTGRETSVLELLEALNRAGAGERLSQPEFAPERLGEVRHSCLDPGARARELGWRLGGRVAATDSSGSCPAASCDGVRHRRDSRSKRGGRPRAGPLGRSVSAAWTAWGRYRCWCATRVRPTARWRLLGAAAPR